MTNKDRYIQSLSTAENNHVVWLSNIKLLASDAISKPPEKVRFYETSLPLWAKLVGGELKSKTVEASLTEINTLVRHLDSDYIALYRLVIINRKKGLLGKRKPLSEAKKSAVGKYFKSITIISEKLDEACSVLARKSSFLGEEHFDFMQNVSLSFLDTGKADSHSFESKCVQSGGARGAYCQA